MPTKTTRTLTSKSFANKTKLRHSQRSIFLSPAARRKCFNPVIGHNKQTCMCQTPLLLLLTSAYCPSQRAAAQPPWKQPRTALHGAGCDEIICLFFLLNKIEIKKERKPQNSTHFYPVIGSALSHTGAECWLMIFNSFTEHQHL